VFGDSMNSNMLYFDKASLFTVDRTFHSVQVLYFAIIIISRHFEPIDSMVRYRDFSCNPPTDNILPKTSDLVRVTNVGVSTRLEKR
jgi:hypothetical protein